MTKLYTFVSKIKNYMTYRIITSILFATIAITALAQTETPDSIKAQNLDEVVVEAQMQRTSPTSTTFIPTVKQKNASQNAIDLLRQMAIPQIQINPVSEQGNRIKIWH